MRAFRISLGLLLLMGVLIALGTCYHRRVCRELTEQVSALSDTKEAAAQATDLIEEFERHKRLLLPIIQRSLLRGVEDLLREERSSVHLPRPQRTRFRAAPQLAPRHFMSSGGA